MKKLLKRIRIALLTVLVLILLLILISYINHEVQLSKENVLFKSIGTQVEVNGHSMNVYTEGSGNATGITRWFQSLAESDAIKYGTLTADEKELYKVIFYRRTGTTDMINEVQKIKTSAKKVADSGVPDVPILMFSSNGIGTGMNKYVWQGF